MRRELIDSFVPASAGWMRWLEGSVVSEVNMVLRLLPGLAPLRDWSVESVDIFVFVENADRLGALREWLVLAVLVVVL